jgi:hypothetical protein
MIIGMPVYDGVDLLDVAGPHEILKWIPDEAVPSPVEVQIIAKQAGGVTTRDGFTFMAKKSFADSARSARARSSSRRPASSTAMRRPRTAPSSPASDSLRR